MIIGHTVLHFSTLTSSNVFALDYIAKNSPIEGTVIKTDYQSEGQGQIGRKWFSDAEKNLLFSIIMKPRFIEPKNQFYFNQAISVAIRSTLEEVIKDSSVLIKWPNDIYIDKKKVAGILIQNTINKSVINYSVVGIGLNVNQKNFPSDLPNPTSLVLELGQKLDRDELLQNIFQSIEHQYLKLRAGKVEEISNEYQQYLLGINQKLNFKDAESQFSAVLKGTDKDGRLLLLKEDQKCYYTFGEITYLDFKSE